MKDCQQDREQSEQRKASASNCGSARSAKAAGRKTATVTDSILSLLLCVCLIWSAFHIHPGGVRETKATPEPTESPAVTAEVVRTPEPTPIPAGSEVPIVTPVPTPVPTPEPPHYTIAPDAAVAPAPLEDAYGSAGNDSPQDVIKVIESARRIGLLREDEEVAFRTDAQFYQGYHRRDIQYYLDETILVICWKEVIDGCSCTLAEVKVADPSQFRRKLAGDKFGSGRSQFASDLSKSVNAIVAMNADYYGFRDLGIVAYNGELYRFNTGSAYRDYFKYNCIPTLFITSTGDFVYIEQGETHTEESVRAFMKEHDVSFSLAFGPILVKDGKAQEVNWYPLGEALQGYSRAGIGQIDELHYLYFSLNHGEKAARWTVNDFARYFAEFPVKTAYCLDGGQTGELVIRGVPYNYIDFGAERAVSDIIYFASALPEKERSIQGE